MSLFQPLPIYTVSSREKMLDLSRPQIMGILNVTPDSFSDGGQFNAIDSALAHAKEMIAAGATIIDIGGESTRPNAAIVATSEELQRVVPVVKAIRQQLGDVVWLSIDTSNPTVMRAAFEAGADIWNDVRALKCEGAAALAAELDIPVMLMHMRGEPTTMNNLAQYDDVIKDVSTELAARVDEVINHGVKRENIIIDPGFGFAKNAQQNLKLLQEFHLLTSLGYPILSALSRKRFIGEVLDQSNAQNRVVGSVAAHLLSIQQGACMVRVHDVKATSDAIKIWQAMNCA